MTGEEIAQLRILYERYEDAVDSDDAHDGKHVEGLPDAEFNLIAAIPELLDDAEKHQRLISVLVEALVDCQHGLRLNPDLCQDEINEAIVKADEAIAQVSGKPTS